MALSIIKPEGFLFISDPAPNDNDTSRFVDGYMKLKKEGRIKFYTKDEWLQICGKYGLQFQKSFDSTIRFPRKKDISCGFDELSCIYADDIYRHMDLCKRYPMLANEWEQFIMAYISNIEKSENYNAEQAKEQIKRLSEKIKDECS